MKSLQSDWSSTGVVPSGTKPVLRPSQIAGPPRATPSEQTLVSVVTAWNDTSGHEGVLKPEGGVVLPPLGWASRITLQPLPPSGLVPNAWVVNSCHPSATTPIRFGPSSSSHPVASPTTNTRRGPPCSRVALASASSLFPQQARSSRLQNGPLASAFSYSTVRWPSNHP